MNVKRFYEEHKNFSGRTLTEYLISPGIRCKFNLIKTHLGSRTFNNGVDLGCSGNSLICFLENILHKSYYDLASIPLIQYSKIKLKKINRKDVNEYWHPLCGDLTALPYKDGSFDFVCALDVLEHIKNDKLAISEISRILKKKGILIITVPHRMKFYTQQDKLIGHYRRYEVDELFSVFSKFHLRNIKIFGVYGKLMKIADIQSTNPQRVEKNLQKLRNRYSSNILFRKVWDVFVKISSLLMKLDAKYSSLNNKMNLGFIFLKES
ncbi:MAG: class I SAM-dependent methyltransferase [Promethearchaeota archaeon]|nr:MAG: class I SAM-dependent methyltransferase [Candidatus Lokiarchaeota archaeon]